MIITLSSKSLSQLLEKKRERNGKIFEEMHLLTTFLHLFIFRNMSKDTDYITVTCSANHNGGGFEEVYLIGQKRQRAKALCVSVCFSFFLRKNGIKHLAIGM